MTKERSTYPYVGRTNTILERDYDRLNKSKSPIEGEDDKKIKYGVSRCGSWIVHERAGE